MASSKSGLSRVGCSKLFKSFDLALKKSARHLLLSTTHGLNNSWSKKITVGLRVRLDGTFEPVVKLLNNYSSGVTLSVVGWQQLIEKFEIIENYVTKDEERVQSGLSNLLNDTIALDNCSLRFTTSHGSRVVAFYSNLEEYEEVDEEQGGTADDSNDAGPGPAKKPKKKAYSPVIVMQKVTVQGLRHMACCVNEHLLQLEVLVDDVNRCKESLVRYFALLAISRKMKSPTLQQIGALVYEDEDAAREVISLQAESGFRERYFDIVFCELMRMFLGFIIVDVRQSVASET